jgi:hypothetical protein
MPGYEHDAAFDNGMLPVSSLHQVYYEQYGEPNGKPGIESSVRSRSSVLMLSK